MNNILKQILNELDENKSMEHIEWLTKNTPSRISSMGQDKIAAEYIVEEMKSYGLETELLEFETYTSVPMYSELKVLSPENKTINSIPCAHISSTLPEGLKTELVHVGAGGYEDYENIDVQGKTVLVEVSYAPATPEKARIAAEKGAIGMICMNWGSDINPQDEAGFRGLKSVWGNPTVETFNEIPQIAGISISRPAGKYLIDLCNSNKKVEILIKAESTRTWEKVVQPMGVIRGSEEPDKFMLVNGHYDAWEPGVTCNATGNGVLLELARVFAKYKKYLKRSIYFVFWNGHEIAEAAGSTWFTDYYWDDMRDNCIGTSNIDSPGLKGAVKYVNDVSRELSDFAKYIISDKLDEDVDINYLTKIADNSFLGLGIPSLIGRMSFDAKNLEEHHGASFGWWNHTSKDDLDKVDIEVLKKDLPIEATYIFELINSKILPYDFTKNIMDIYDKLKYLYNESGNLLELDRLVKKAQKLMDKIEKLNLYIRKVITDNSEKEEIRKLNWVLMKLSRILTSSFYTNCEPYQQDSYGLTILSKPIPLLYPVIELKELEPSDLRYKLLYTTLLRNRNRISDTLNNSIELIENFLS